MLYATNRFHGDGGTTTYEFNFTGGYLQREHVKAYIENAAGERTAVPVNPGNWINAYTLGGLPTTPVGSTFVIYRETPRLPLVDFTTNSRMTEGNLDITARQGVFVAAEALDQDGGGGVGGGGTGGGGAVFGPPSSAYTGIAEFADTSGKLLRSTYVSVAQLVGSIAEKAPSTHTHANATTSTAGFMSALDKTKLDTMSGGGGTGGGGDVFGPPSSTYTGIAEFADTSGKLLRTTNVSVAQLNLAIDAKAEASHTHPVVTPSAPGLMTPADKVKLDSISGGAGGAGGTGDVVGPAVSSYTGIAEFADTTGKLLRSTNYSAQQLHDDIQTRATQDHGHAVASPSQNGFMSSADKTKLDSLTPGGGGTAPAKLRIVVIGDSMSAQQNALGQAWPGLLEDSIRANGVDVEVHNLAINGMSFGNVNSEVSFNGKATMQARAISLNPDIVLVALGANDAVTGTRTTATQAATVTAMTNAATSLFSALRSALPSAVILYASQTTWDRTHKPNPNSTGLLSREAPGLYQQRTTSGLAAGMVSPQMMTLSLTADENSRFAGFYLADNAIRALGTHDGVIEVDMWRINRLGCLGADNAHANATGHRLTNAAIYGGLRANPAAMSKLVSLGHQLAPYWNDLTQVFNTYMVDSGGAWVERNNLPAGDLHLSRHIVDAGSIRPVTWFYPSGGHVTTNALNLVENAVFTATGTGLVPRALVYVSNNGATWTASECYTDAFGNVSISYSHKSLSYSVPTSFTFYLRAGEEVFGPFPLAVAASTAPSGVTGPAAATAGALASFTDTSGKVLTNTGRTIAQIDAAINAKQATLVSGSSIKTVGGATLLGAGDVPFPAAPPNTLWAASGPLTTLVGNGGGWTPMATITIPVTGNLVFSWGIGGTSGGAVTFATFATLSNGISAFGSSCTLSAAGKFGMAGGTGVVNGVTAGMTITVYAGADGAAFQPTQLVNGSYWTALITRA